MEQYQNRKQDCTDMACEAEAERVTKISRASGGRLSVLRDPSAVLNGATLRSSLLSQEMTDAVRLIAWMMLALNSSHPSEALLPFLVVANKTLCISSTAACRACELLHQ